MPNVRNLEIALHKLRALGLRGQYQNLVVALSNDGSTAIDMDAIISDVTRLCQNAGDEIQALQHKATRMPWGRF